MSSSKMKTIYYAYLTKKLILIVLPKLLGLTSILFNYKSKIMNEDKVEFQLSECEVFSITK